MSGLQRAHHNGYNLGQALSLTCPFSRLIIKFKPMVSNHFLKSWDFFLKPDKSKIKKTDKMDLL
jgi:hypothetical protein